MTPSVRNTIRELFPTNADGVLDNLTRYGNGLGHAGSAITYEAVLRNANGDSNRVTDLIDWALADETSFHKYLRRWLSWSYHARRLSDQSFADVHLTAPIIHETAVEAAEYACSVVNSHYTLCLHPDAQEPIQFKLFLVPIMGGAVYISTDIRARECAKLPSIADECPGQLVAGSSAVDHVLAQIAREFDHDCVSPRAA